MSTLTHTSRLVVSVCWCGIAHAIPVELDEHQERQHRDGREQTAIYCPLGHSYIRAGKGEAARLREQLAAEQDRRASITAELDQVTGSLRATRGAMTRLRKRAHAGTCPFGCRRHFADLERHIATKHPGRTLEGET